MLAGWAWETVVSTRADGTQLLRRGVPAKVVEEYIEAVDAAWADASWGLMEIGSPIGSRPSMSLDLKDPDRDSRTVTITIGVRGHLGSVEAKTPPDLRIALARHLRKRFGYEF